MMPSISVLRLVALCSSLFLMWTASASESLGDLLDCEGEDADSQLCIDKEAAFELKARIEVIYASIDTISDPLWDAASYSQTVKLYQEANDLYDRFYFSDAKTKLQKCLDSFTSYQTTHDSEVSKLRAKIIELNNQDGYEEALVHIERLLHWLPDDKKLEKQYLIAQQGSLLKDVVTQIESHIESEQFEQAAALVEQVPEGYWTIEVDRAKTIIFQHRTEVRFNAAMSDGFKFRDDEDWLEARQAFTQALQVQPSSTVAQAALDDVNERIKLARAELLLDLLEAQEQSENWEHSLTTIKELDSLQVSTNYVEERRERVSTLLEIEARLTKHSYTDIRDFDKNKRDQIQELLAETRRYTQSDRIQTVFEKVSNLFDAYTTPVKVTLLSDRKTNVQIIPGRSLGRFKKKIVKILPGTYEITGTRRRFHQVVQNLIVQPNSDTIEVEIVCSARF